MTRNTLLRGGTVVDGTGSPAFDADVLIRNDRVAAVGRDLPDDDVRVIDVNGRVVCPGFIDLHSHADSTLLAFPEADSAIRQGITTVAVGNCGGGVAPTSPHDDVREIAFAHNSDWGIELDWSSFGGYTAHLDGCAINVAPLVAHGAIRNAAMGLAPRPATTREIDAMAEALRNALDDGAFGMSTGLQYAPGMWAEPDEISSLVSIVGGMGRMYATHMRNRADSFAASTQEAIEAAAGTGAHLQLSHFAPRPYAPRQQVAEAFEAVAEAESSGQSVGIDTFPEIWGPGLLIDLFPSEVLAGSAMDVLTRLSGKGARQAVDDYFEAQTSFLSRIAGYDEIYISGTPQSAELVGRSLTDIASHAGASVGSVSCDLLLAAGELFRAVGIRHIYATEPDLRMTLGLPYCSVESDGIVTSGEGPDCPLTWNASSYGYTARMLGHYVRNEQFFTIEEAVRKMTLLPASALGLRDRGEVTAGFYADLVVFDPETVLDLTSPDDVARHPAGIDLVIVNGEAAVSHGSASATHHGRLLQP
jgi:N-acyl-D-aspartate/D-glutamate deacylase